MKKFFIAIIVLVSLFASPVLAQETVNLEDLQNDPTMESFTFDPDEISPDEFAFEDPQAIEFESEYFRGKVKEILEDDIITIGSFAQPYQKITVEIISGDEKGVLFEHDWQFTQSNSDRQKFEVGDKVVVVKVIGNQTQYYVAEPYRLPSVIWVFALFVLIAFLFAGKKGLSALVGLVFSIFVIIKFILPQIVAGRDPVLISVIGAFIILFVALYLAHGFNKRTHVAMVGTSVTLAISALFATFVVSFTQLFGLGSEEAISLLQGPFKDINLQGLLLGGIIIGALGVLDDVTTAQSATVAEIHRANPKLGVKELYKRGSAVGKEHIASLINTLALAYVGASLPLMLIFTKVDFPLWINLNSEFIVEELMRTLIGSSALILAVPITTYIAARIFHNDPVDRNVEIKPMHTHSH